MDIPSLFMIPSAVSSGKVHSVFPNSTDADFDFNRDSDATRVNSEGLIERVGYYGSEKITNGTFDADSNWGKSSGATISNGQANIVVTGGSFQYIDQGISYVAGKEYRLTATIQGTSGKALRFQDNASNTGGLQVSNGTVNFNGNIQAVDITWAANSNSNILIIARSGAGDFSFTVDNVSVKEITGDRARLNYEIEGGLVNTKPSLLLEPQRTNVILQSQDITTNWSRGSEPTLTSNIAVAPDGTLTADGIQANTDASFQTVRQLGISVSSNSTVSNSYFVKKETSEDAYGGFGLVFTGVSTKVFYGIVDAVNGTVTISGSNLTGTTKVEDYGNYWRICATTTDTGSNTSLGVYHYGTLSLNGTSLSAGLGSVRTIWGMQTELNQSYCTSYIPTNGSTQTRAAETCNGAGTSSIFESSEGILYAEIAALANNADTLRWINLNNGATTNRVAFYYRTDENQLTYLVSSGTTQVFSTITLSSASSFIKIAAKWKANDFALWVDGVKVVTDTSGNSPVGLNQLSFDNGAGGSNFYGKLRDIRVYNTKEMTDSEVDILLTKITS